MYDLKGPCANCPFRTDITFYLGEARAEEIADALRDDSGMFTCHKTAYETRDEAYKGKEQQCAGALIVLLKEERMTQMMRIAARTGWKYDAMHMDAPVFDTLDDFVQRQVTLEHAHPFGKRMARRLPAALRPVTGPVTFPVEPDHNSLRRPTMYNDGDSHRINLRAKDAERKVLEKAAKAAGIPVTSYVKDRALKAAEAEVGKLPEPAKKPVKTALRKKPAPAPVKKAPVKKGSVIAKEVAAKKLAARKKGGKKVAAGV